MSEHSCSLAAGVLVGSACILALASGCDRQSRMELSPKFTRASHPVDAKDAQILSPANYEKVTPGMTQDEVLAVFGTKHPTVSGYQPHEEYELVWEHADKEIVVRFRGAEAISKSQKGVLTDGP